MKMRGHNSVPNPPFVKKMLAEQRYRPLHLRPDMILMLARRPSECAGCGEHIFSSSVIVWEPSTHRVWYAGCHPSFLPTPATKSKRLGPPGERQGQGSPEPERKTLMGQSRPLGTDPTEQRSPSVRKVFART